MNFFKCLCASFPVAQCCSVNVSRFLCYVLIVSNLHCIMLHLLYLLHLALYYILLYCIYIRSSVCILIYLCVFSCKIFLFHIFHPFFIQKTKHLVSMYTVCGNYNKVSWILILWPPPTFSVSMWMLISAAVHLPSLLSELVASVSVIVVCESLYLCYKIHI